LTLKLVIQGQQMCAPHTPILGYEQRTAYTSRIHIYACLPLLCFQAITSFIQ